MTNALDASEGVPFTDEERELLADSLARLRVRLDAAADALRTR